MSDEEEDYMSTKYLETAQAFESTRKETYSERRKKQLREQQEKGYIKPRAQLEKEERERGLKQHMDEKNKGMKMLMKMGFKKGSGLGQQQSGIMEPIAIDLKAGRSGIGMDTQLLKRAREAEEEEARKRVEIDPEDYRLLMAQRAKDAQYTRYIAAAVSVCEKLDEENKVESNILWTLKPATLSTEEEEKEEEEKEEEEKKPVYPQDMVDKLKALSLEHQLEALVEYLRDTYFYCFWCRAKYDDKQDLDTNCPGTEEDDH
ncbi:hypothetical protein INT47_013187 [Mucor saturninus]|uniref:G-patch domain-containing protein n=1 Tax=Mucor saturninus TaxID=64648 RepID=A0A8H7UX02_9FUNG|nr:hypothetical protein INT47_013187 [Mucor saturninus]